MLIRGIKDFNTEHVFECGQCFRWNRVEGENDEALASPSYVGVVGDYVCKAKCLTADDGYVDLVLETTGGDEAFWRHYFDLETDYSEIKSTIINKEAKIKAATEYGYGIRILNQDLFETLISFIISQNNNIPRIKKCIEAISRHYGKSLGMGFGEERFAFPSAEVLASVPVCELAELKLGYRCEYIVDSAQRFLREGEPKNYDEVLAYLGIGPKVANCIMLFGLHAVDAFPIDTWVKHIMNDMYGFAESDTRGMKEFAAERFGDYAGYAQQYLFYYYRDRR